MTPALVFTILGFALTILTLTATFAYLYGRLTMQVETMKGELATRASKDSIGAVEASLDRLTELYEKFLTDVDGKLDRARDTGAHDDARMLGAVAHLEGYMEECVVWIGERMGGVGRTLNDHERILRKVVKASGVSDDRFPAVGDTGRHDVVPPPPRPGAARPAGTAVAGTGRVPTMPGRKDTRSE